MNMFDPRIVALQHAVTHGEKYGDDAEDVVARASIYLEFLTEDDVEPVKAKSAPKPVETETEE